MRLPKIFPIIISLILIFQNSAFARFGSGPTFSSSSSSGGSGGVSVAPLYANGPKDTPIAILTSNLITNGDYQYALSWDSSYNLFACKWPVDSVQSKTCVVYDGRPKAAVFSGAGLNDLTAGGTATSGITATSTYEVEIDATGAPDTFKWRYNGGAYTTGVSTSLTAVTLSNGVTISFGATTGHTVGNSWTITVNPLIHIVGDVHQGVGIVFDKNDVMWMDLGSYVTEGGLHLRHMNSANSIDGISAEVQISATYDAQASYFTPFAAYDGEVYAYYRSNGASGAADEFLWKLDADLQTWSRAPGTRSSGVIGSFIDGNSVSRSAYMAHPYIDSNNNIHFVWSWQDNAVAYGTARQSNASYTVYNATNGTFKKGDGTTQTIPITLSNDDPFWDSPSSLTQEFETMAYAHSVALDASGRPNVVFVKNSGDTHSITFSPAVGTNDLLIDYTTVVNAFESQPKYEIVVQSAATPDTFKYRINGGAYTTSVAMTTHWQTLTGGLRVKWTANTGHTVNDAWTIYPVNGYHNIYWTYHNGTSWQTPVQITNTAETHNTNIVTTEIVGDGLRKRPSILFNGSKAYVVWSSVTQGNGLQVIETSDSFATVKNYSIQLGGTTTNTSIAPGTMDPVAWNDSKKFYILTQDAYTSDNVTLATSHTSPIFLLKWDPAQGSGDAPQNIHGIVTYGDLFFSSMRGSVRLAGMISFADQALWWVKSSDSPQEWIPKVTAGDTLMLPSKSFTLKESFALSKAIHIIGAGEIGSCGTTFTSATAMNMITPTVSNATIENVCITNTGNGTARGIYATSAVSSPLSGIDVRNVKITLSGTGAKNGILRQNSSGISQNVTYSITSSDSTAIAEYLQNTSTVGSATSVQVYSPKCNTSGGGSANSRCFASQDATASQTSTMKVYGGFGTSVEGAASTSSGAYAFGGADAILEIYGTTLSGTDADIEAASSATLRFYGGVLVNGTTAGTITYAGYTPLYHQILNGTLAIPASTIAADDTTPDVSTGTDFITSANTGATAITDLDNPKVGQRLCITGGSATNSSTIADSGNFNLSAAWTAGLDDTLCLRVQADNDYVEISRADN